ncbi:signal recognition particle-docking protein FtsY [Companilactobacillus kimchiensis]|uniref:Signal recognition particle receptor FtsY n=1 Tax=Companilactobacillus kimchiensis TaxID=993692 RepID=A0A0R2LHQ8_9LACO|nr:signal recognition particle-docking protein FtsY [Companilactobacillus kimchiensis]KRO00983.1 Signal recognition particle-docking protein FtsY [Companilactobacillus kimchiensis]
MGLFDRIKKAFTGKDSSEDKDLEKKSTVESEKESDQKVESTEQTDVEQNTEETPVEPEEPAAVETPEESESTEEKAVTEPTPEPETKPIEKPEEPATSEPEEPEEPEQPEKLAEVETPKTVVPEEPKESEDSEETVESETPKEDTESAEPEQPVDVSDTEEPNEDAVEPTDTETEAEPKDDIKEYDEGLKKSRNSFSARFNRFLANFRSVDEDFFDDLEELLIESDVGYETAMRISDELREEVKLENAKKRSDVSNVIVQKLVDMYGEEGKEEDNSLKFSADKTPTVFLFVGVNGAGKTTTVGKLAHRYQQQGKKVLLAAADTFRAGAIEQLQEWGKRDGVPVQASKAHTDPASVVYDAVQRAISEDFDILLVDTAGRLQNKEGLMRELEKIKRVITRELPDAPQEVLLVLDGSTGQNALSQAKQFNETTQVSGIVLTKLDGSSQGGIVLAIRNELHIPVKLVGLGEQMDDLRDFDPEKFIYGLFKELIVGASNK